MKEFIKYVESDVIVMDDSYSIDFKKNELPSGVYTLTIVGNPMMEKIKPAFKELELPTNLIKFKSGVFHTVLSTVDEFFSPETIKRYRDMNILHKMGIALYGPPGTGKTSLSYMILTDLQKKYNAICVEITNSDINYAVSVLSEVRRIQKNPIVVFCDEWDLRVARSTNWLTFLDGSMSIDGCVFIGCTNYMEKIPKTISYRRSRIKEIIEVKALPVEVYKDYISTTVATLSPAEVTKIAYYAEDAGLTIDELKNCLIDYYILGMPIEKSIASVRKFAGGKSWEKGWNKEEGEEEENKDENDDPI